MRKIPRSDAILLPDGFKNEAVLFYYKRAKDGGLYSQSPDLYLLTNERQFFAVTASVFLYGQDHALARAELKQKQPEYYQYLVWMFGFDPDRSPMALDLTRTPGSTVN
jgi:hypothetical protein